MKTLRILFTVLSAACIAACLPVGSLAGWGYAAICAAGAFCFFALMLLCKQSQNNAERTPTALPEESRQTIDQLLAGAASDPERLIEGAAQALAAATGCAAVGTSPCDHDACVRRIELIPMQRRSLALLLMTGSGTLRTRVCRTEQQLDEEVLGRLSRALSETFLHRPVGEIGLADVQGLVLSLGEHGLACAPVLTAFYELVQEAAAAETPMEAPAEPEEEFTYDTVATTEAGSGAAETPEPDDSVADYTAKIIYTASVSIETTEFDKAVAALENQVQKIGGFVESSNVTGDTQYNSDGTTTVVNRWAYYTVRIPCEQFEAFLHETEGFGNVISTSRDAQNVTSAYTDYEARLSSLNTQEERLLDMLSKSEDVETLIALEQRLSDVRYEIESIERNLRNYDMQIKYSTVNLDLREVEVYTPTVPVRRTFSQKLANSLSDGWNGFTRGIQNVILGLASALPALILLAVITAAVIVCIKKARKKRKAKKAAQDPTPPQDPQ